MKITYENEWEHTDVHIDMPFPYEEDYRLRMLKHNDIECLLKVKGCGRESGSRYTYYVNGGMVSMKKQYSMKEMVKENISSFIEQLMSAVDELKSHLLNPDGILLSPELIFIKDGRYYFCYLPVPKSYEKKSLCTAFHEMAEYFVKKLDYRDTDGVFLVYRIHKETMEESYDLRKILESCREDERKRKEKQETKSEREEEITEDSSEEGGLSEGAVFYLNDEEEEEHEIQNYTRKKDTGMIAENSGRYGTVRKAIHKIKTGYWGEWDDLITEMDGQKR